MPPLSDTNTVRVTVAEFLELSLGSTVLRAGQSTNVPIEIESPLPVTNVQFSIATDLSRLRNFSLSGLASGVLAYSIQQSDPQHLIVSFTLQPASFVAATVLGHLDFEATAGQVSAFVPLRVLDLAAYEPSGITVPATLPIDGRVTVVGNEPLLEAMPQHTLILHGVPGSAYRIESTTDLSAPAWQPAAQGMLSGFSQVINVPAATMLFYRVVQP